MLMQRPFVSCASLLKPQASKALAWHMANPPPTVILKSMGMDGLTNCQHAAAASGTVGLQDAPGSALRSMRDVAAQARGRI